ncbi:unnamed protein product [Prunus armeniaca]|uniref:Uncharacterized protein n=1 Tax=Prunus armeniaca TaxID=36596 RepID=A0A6J5Y749_PRUAR|nr:unnamed protein product [Prunus armeniaca]
MVRVRLTFKHGTPPLEIMCSILLTQNSMCKLDSVGGGKEQGSAATAQEEGRYGYGFGGKGWGME